MSVRAADRSAPARARQRGKSVATGARGARVTPARQPTPISSKAAAARGPARLPAAGRTRPGAATRRRAAKAPFVLLVVALLAVGLVALLMLNTSLNEGAFTLQRLQSRSDGLRDDIQAAQQQVNAAAAPGTLAQRAKALGMVPNTSPGFLDLRTGRILGDPRPAQPFTEQLGPLIGLGEAAGAGGRTRP